MPIRTWRELQYLVNQKQKGYDVDEQLREHGVIPNPTDEEKKLLQIRASDSFNRARNFGTSAAIREQEMLGVAAELDALHNQDLSGTGFGESKYDQGIDFRDWIQDPIDYRANAQSTATKFFNGAAKLVPYAATTFLDNTVGLLGAVTNVIGSGDVPLVSTSKNHSFIDTPFAEAMQKVRDWSEEMFPNFRTTEEIEEQDQWWKHLNANFWGDTFLKNLGFTIGAMGSGAVYSAAFRKMQGKAIREAYKAAVAASVDGNVAAEEAFRRVLQGGAMQNPAKIYRTFAETKKKFERIGALSQFIGGVGGAVGESRVEAMGAAKEFRDEFVASANQKYEQAKQALEQSLLRNIDYVVMTPSQYDTEGNVTGWKPILNGRGLQALEVGERKLQQKYKEEIQAIDNESTKLANTTFWLNMPLLTADNIIMFGRLFSGGYNSQAKNLVRRMSDGTYAAASGNAAYIAKGAANATWKSLSEGNEEIQQKVFSEGAKDIAAHNMAAFNNGSYDKDAIHTVSDWILSMTNSANNVYTDPTSWEEFAVGALTGALGMPTTKGWQGGVIGGYKEIADKQKLSEKYADSLNKLSQDPEFRARWEGLVRHVHYDKQKEAALSKDDKFAWHSANDAQLISDVMTFANAGRLNDLEDMVESFGNIKLSDIPSLRAALIDENDSQFASKSDAQLLEWLQARVADVKKTIQQYRDFHDSINFLSLGTTDEKTVNELIYTQAQLQNFEDRYIRLSDEVIAQIRPALEQAAKLVDKDGNPTKQAKVAQTLLASTESLRRVFGGYALDIHDRQNTASGLVATIMDDTRQAEVLNELEQLGAFSSDSALKEKVSDLQKLVRSRQSFYAKLFDPSFRGKFEEQAVTAQQAASNLEADASKKQAEDIYNQLAATTTLKDYIALYNALPNVDPQVAQLVNDKLQADPRLKQYEDTIQRAWNFVDMLRANIDDKQNHVVDPSQLKPLEDFAAVLDTISIDDVLSAMADGADSEIAIAEDIVSRLAPGSAVEGVAKTILTEILKDRANSLKFGNVPTGGTGNGNGNGNGSSSSSSTGGSDSGTGSSHSGGTSNGSGNGSEANSGNGTGTNAGNDSETGSGNNAGGNGNPGATGDGNNAGTGDSGSGTTQSVDMQGCIDYINSVADINDSTLIDYSLGNFVDLNLTEDEKFQLVELAIKRLQYLKEQAGLLAENIDGFGREELGTDSDDDASDPARVRAHQEFVTMDTESVRGAQVSEYDQRELRKGRVRKFTASNPGVRATIEWKRKHHVQQFIDSGALATLEQEYAKNGKQLPIFFLGNPHFLENNLENNPFVTSYPGHPEYQNVAANVVLAIEMTDENRKKLVDYEQAGIFSEDTLIEVDGVKYQVIGELWNPSPKDIANKPESEREGYERVKAESNRIWDYAMKLSILPRYASDKEKVGEAGFPPDGKWYVARVPQTASSKGESTAAEETPEEKVRIYTTLNYIMSGRNETRAPGSNEYQKIPLLQSLTDYRNLHGEIAFAMSTKDGVITSANVAFPPSIKAPKGSLWIATREANGQWAWTYVTIARTDEVNLIDFQNTEYGKIMKDALEEIFAPTIATDSPYRKSDFLARVRSTTMLCSMFYLGKNNVIHFAFVNGRPALYVGGALCYSADEVLQALQTGKYRFQVSADDLHQNYTIARLVESGILMTEMRSFIRKGASIGVNFLSDKDIDGNTITPRPRQAAGTVGRTAGSNRSDVVGAFSNGISNIRIGNAGYQLSQEGRVYRMGANNRPGEEVLDRVTVAQVKALSELIQSGGSNYRGKHFIVEQSLPRIVTQTVKNTDKKTGKTINETIKKTVSEPLQYAELYEREIDGVTVRMQRRGKNGAFQILYSDAEWDALMEVARPADASRYVPQPSKPSSVAQPATPVETVPSEANSPTDSVTGSEAPNQSSASGESTQHDSKSKSSKGRLSRRGRGNKPLTVQQQSESEESEHSEEMCG